MGALSKILRNGQDNHLSFWCPGCDEAHGINASKWNWNGNAEKPTFSPSVLVTSGHYMTEHTGDCWCTYTERTGNTTNFKCHRCHSFVIDGMIQFLGDCSHALAGQTVLLPEWPILDDYLKE